MLCKTFLLLSVTFFVTFYETRAYDWGGLSKACDNMIPKLDENAEEMSDLDYYRLGPNKEIFYPGEKLYIRIKGKTSDDRYTYTGLLLNIKKDGPVGTWEKFHKDKYRTINCRRMKASGIIEANNRPKVVGDDVFVWTAPDSCDNDNNIYELSATIIKNDREYISRLAILLECVPKPDMSGNFDVGEDACAANYSVIPVASTSFETNFGGWWNDPKSPLRWTRHTGPTKSPKTGPSFTADGKWYIYPETSYPAQQYDVAILNSPVGLAGCFCIRLQCHMFTGPGTKFALMVNGEVGFTHETPADRWLKAYETVNIAGEVQIQLMVTRGIDFRGDLAIDDIRFTPGMCEEDIKG